MAKREQLSSPNRGERSVVVAICVGLIAIIAIVFGQSVHHGFVNYDDNTYVYENPRITRGLSVDSLRWAFSHVHSSNWHPLTTISHILDCQLYSLDAGGHHLTNCLLHSAATVLLFLVLRALTGATWRSAFVAAIFAVHPLHVESVAWISERKDVLSGVFFMLTLGAYSRYARVPSLPRYLLVAFVFSLGLLAKPMLVTTPFILLLLDYWPLNRFTNRVVIRRLVAEKTPLLLLSAGSCAATLFAQKGIIITTRQLPIWWRVGNALVSYAVYLWQTIWPTRLSAFYPMREDESELWPVVGALALLIGITTAVIILRRIRPYLFTGWFWYLGMLVPVIGFIQVGVQAHADRYTYLPQIGLGIAAVWGISDLAQWLNLQRTVRFAAVALIAVLVFLSWRQTGYWRNGETLWTHALSVTNNNEIAHYGLGDIFVRQSQFDKAISEFRATLSIRPQWPYAEDYLGLVLLKAGRVDEAIRHFETTLQLMPNHPTIHFDLGNALFQKGDVDGAVQEYQEALRKKSEGVVPGFVQPDYAAAHYDLGNCYIQRGDVRGAIAEFKEALKSFPDSPQIHNNLAYALSQAGETREPIAQWEEALRIQKNNIEVLGNLAWILATSSDPSVRNGPRALSLVQQAENISANNPKILRVLAAARAETGDFQTAIETASKARELANQTGDTGLADSLQSDLLRYQSHTALRE